MVARINEPVRKSTLNEKTKINCRPQFSSHVRIMCVHITSGNIFSQTRRRSTMFSFNLRCSSVPLFFSFCRIIFKSKGSQCLFTAFTIVIIIYYGGSCDVFYVLRFAIDGGAGVAVSLPWLLLLTIILICPLHTVSLGL